MLALSIQWQQVGVILGDVKDLLDLIARRSPAASPWQAVHPLGNRR